MAVYRPKFVPQWNDPTTGLDWFNCTMASGAMALDFDTLGRIQVRGGQLRAVSGDYVGGTNLGSPGLTQAWSHYGQVLHVQTGHPWSDVISALKASRGVVLQGMYGALPKQYRSTVNSIGFTGAHAVYLNPEFNANGDILMGDPLWNKYIWVPQSALKAFATALSVRERISGIFFATTDAHVPVVAPPPYQWHIFIAEGTTDIITATVVLGRVVKWTHNPWGGNASSAPSTKAYTAKSISGAAVTLVKVTGGKFVGQTVKVAGGITVK